MPYLPARALVRRQGRAHQPGALGDAIPVPRGSRAPTAPAGFLALIDVEYAEGDPETYLLPLTARARRTGGRPRSCRGPRSRRLTGGEDELVLFDAA